MMSDTHCHNSAITVPDGDLLIHSGDLCLKGTQEEAKKALKWLAGLPHEKKILVPGNHDWWGYSSHPWLLKPKHFRTWSLFEWYTLSGLMGKFPGITLLIDQSHEFQGWKIYGSPWQPWFWDWAFQFPQFDGDVVARKIWSQIPDNTEILVTHGPPLGILDGGYHFDPDDHPGDPYLRNRVEELNNLRLHVFGHVHVGYGTQEYEIFGGKQTHPRRIFVNAATCDEHYKPINPPIVIDLER